MWNFDKILFFEVVVVRSFTADSNLLQPTGVWTEHPHTSHFLVFVRTHDIVSHDIGSRCQCASYHPCVMLLCVWSLFDPLFALFICLSHLLLHLPDLSLHLLCGSVRSKTPCALPRMRSLALWPTTPLSQMQVWRASCQDPILLEPQDKIKLTLSCLGGHLQIHGDIEPSNVVLGEQAPWKEQHNASGELPPRFPTSMLKDSMRRQWMIYSPCMLENCHHPCRPLGVGSAVQRHAAAPWRAWQSVISTSMATTQSPDTDTLFNTAPRLRAQLVQLQTTCSPQMKKPAFFLKPLGAALRQKAPQKMRVTTIQRHFHKQLLDSLTTTPVDRAVLPSQPTSHTGAHSCSPAAKRTRLRVAVARWMLPYPATCNAAGAVQSCSFKSAAGQICPKAVDLQQHHCYGCRYGRGVDRRHAAVARCPADVIHPHSGIKAFIEQEARALTRVVNGQRKHARMDLVSNLNGSVTHLDVSIVARFSCSPSLVAAASTRPGHMANGAEKSNFDRFPHINLVPLHPWDHRPPWTTRQKIY